MQKIYTIKETANLVGLSVSTIQREIKEDRFPAGLKIAKGRRGWNEQQLEEWQSSLVA